MLKNTPARKKYTTTGCVVVTSISFDCIGHILIQASPSPRQCLPAWKDSLICMDLAILFLRCFEPHPRSNSKGSFAQKVFFKVLLCEYISIATFPISSKVLNAQVLTAVRWDFRLQASDTRICCIPWFGKNSRLVKRSFNSSKMVM